MHNAEIDPSSTLRAGLVLFRKKNSRYFGHKSTSIQTKDLMEAHDVAHVIFEANTTLCGEGIVKIWTHLGTDLSFSESIRIYRKLNAFHLFQGFSAKHVLRYIIPLIFRSPRVVYHTLLMRSPWPFLHYQSYLDRTISDIRQEFNIHIVP